MRTPALRLRFPVRSATALAAFLVVTVPSAAVTPVATLDASPDVTSTLGGTLVADQEVARHDLGGLATRIDLSLPAGVAVDAFHDNLDGTVLLSLDATATLGGTVVGPADVVQWDPATQSASIAGLGALPTGAGVDAVTVDGADLLVSFDVTVSLSGTLFADEDLARWDGAGFSLAFDGSAAGIDPALDLDGAHRLTNGHLLVSFDGFGTVAGIPFADEDVLEYDPVGDTWELASDLSSAYPGWSPADARAVAAREPAQTPPAGILQFSSPTYSRFELQGFAPINVTRSGSTSGSVSVAYTSADGTATDGLDYTAGSGTLTWGPGDGSPKTFNVPLIDDSLTEGDETVLLTLSDPTGGAVLGVPGDAVLTIVDDETTPPGLLEIPTLDLRALILLGLLLAGAGYLALRGRG
jgi:hypothetical protein